MAWWSPRDAGEIVFVSDQAATLLGYEPSDLIGQSVDVLLPEAFQSVHRAHRTRYRADPTPRWAPGYYWKPEDRTAPCSQSRSA